MFSGIDPLDAYLVEIDAGVGDMMLMLSSIPNIRADPDARNMVWAGGFCSGGEDRSVSSRATYVHPQKWKAIVSFLPPAPFGLSRLPFGGRQGHPGGPWEQQDGHKVVQNRIFIDLVMIWNPCRLGFRVQEL